MAEEQSITERAIQSSGWLFARGFLVRLIRIVPLAVLARELSPADFGLVALAQVILNFLVLSSSNGVPLFLVYDRDEGREERIHSAFWLNLVITILELCILAIAVPYTAYISRDPLLPSILIALGATFFLKQLTAIPDALIQRELNHRKLVIRDTVLDFTSGILAIVMALSGWGIWSLILPELISEPVRILWSSRAANWAPRLQIGIGHWKRILKYSLPLIGTNLVNLVANDGDTVLIGAILGQRPLGYYNLAWQTSNIVGRTVGGVVSTISFPALSMVKDNWARIRNAYLRMLSLLAVVSFPVLFGIFVLAEDLIRIVYGPNWENSVILLRIFLMFTIVRSVTSQSVTIFNIVGKPEIGFKFTLAFLPFYIFAILTGIRFGLVGVAVSVAVIRIAGGVVSFWLAGKSLEIPFRESIKTMAPTGLIVVFMGAIAWLSNQILLAWDFNIFIRVGICLSLSILTYIFGIAFFAPDAYKSVTHLIKAFSPSLGQKLDIIERNIKLLKGKIFVP